MKAAIVILSDPNHGTEEAAGRAFNALSAAYDFKQNRHKVQVLFQGTGTRWPAVIRAAGTSLSRALREREGDSEGCLMRLCRCVRCARGSDSPGCCTPDRERSAWNLRPAKPEPDDRGRVHRTDVLRESRASLDGRLASRLPVPEAL